MGIPCYIPSKDRAAQCDLLLQSLKQNAAGLFYPTVVYTYSNSEFARGYEKLQDKWPTVQLLYEYDSEKQFYDFLQSNEDNLIGLFADDCIFYRPCTIWESDLRQLFADENVWTFTYRLGKNVTIRDYVRNRIAAFPAILMESDKYFSWRWNTIDFWDIFGFTVGFDGYIYRAKDLLQLSNRESFGRICFWEKLICQKFNQNLPVRKLMVAPQYSEVFVEQINTTHGFKHNTTGKFNMGLEEINRKWLENNDIDLQGMDFSGVNCTHGEIPFGFTERKCV